MPFVYQEKRCTDNRSIPGEIYYNHRTRFAFKKLVVTRFVILKTIKKRAEKKKQHLNRHHLIIETNVTVENKGEIILIEC